MCLIVINVLVYDICNDNGLFRIYFLFFVSSDVMCGLFYCVYLNEKFMFWREILSVVLFVFFLIKGLKIYICRLVTLDVGFNMFDSG